MVPKRKYLKDLLVQEKIGSYESVIITRKTKKAHRNTAQGYDVGPMNVWKQPRLWVDLIQDIMNYELGQLQTEQKKSNLLVKFVDMVKGRDANKHKLNKYKILVRSLHKYLLKFGLPRDIIQQIIFVEDFKLKSSEVKQLNIYIDMVYYWKNLCETPMNSLSTI